MDLGKGPRQPSMLVKKENERAGKLSRTKYFIRIGETNMMPEIKEPVNLPDGGFIVPMQVDVGSSDFMRPQMPSPGEIRHMFGSDKIDCEPEYARGMDPDWSRVSPTTPAELESKIREWNETTNAVLRRYRDIEQKRRYFDKKIKFSKALYKRTRSEGDKRKNSRSAEQQVNRAGTHKLKKKHWRNWPRELESLTLSNINSSENVEAPSPKGQSSNNCTQDFLSSDGKIVKDEADRIPYIPKKLKLKSFNSAISVVQKMSSDHWIMVDKLYNEIKREKGINLETLNKRVTKIVREIYGNESEFILATIHPNPVKRVIRLGKLMLNVYHEAMFGSRKKHKLLVPGINNKYFAQKYIQAYTFTPQYRTTKMTSKMYERLTASREKPPKCIACYRKNIERETTLQKKLGTRFSAKNSKQMKKITNYRLNRKRSERLTRSNFTKLNSPNCSSSTERRKDAIFNGTRRNNFQKSQMMFYIPPFLAKEQDKSVSDSTTVRTNESNLTLSLNGERSLEEIDTPPETSLEKMIGKADEDEAIKSRTGNLGGGDSLVQFSNDYNYLLSTLYESSSSISLELSKKLSASPLLATFGSSSEEQRTDHFFTSTANILQLNDQLEKMLLKQTLNDSSRSFQEPSSDSDDEHYIDCEGVEDQEPAIFLNKDQVTVQKKCYKYSKWMCITDDCIGHRGYITFFMTVMLGLTTAIFCHDSFLNRVKGDDPTLKDSVKQVIKTFLLGALRLVDGF